MAATQEDILLVPPFSVPVTEPDRADSAWKVGKYTFRADFDSANLGLVKQGPSPSEFHLWTKRDCQDTDHERGTRSWFYFGISGQQTGDFIVMTIMNLNKQGRLFSQDYRPWCWSMALNEWQPMNNKVSYKREGEDFQLRFSHKFEGADEMFFAFAIPFSYKDTQNMLNQISYNFQNYQSIPPECVTYSSNVGSPDTASSIGADPGPPTAPPPQKAHGRSKKEHSGSQIYFNRQLLARSIEGRHVDLITITDCYGASDEVDPLPAAAAMLHRSQGSMNGREGGQHNMPDMTQPVVHFPGKKVFFVSARVHPGETPATHMFNGILSFLLRQHDARAAALRRLFVFKLVPIVNPDGVYHGFYRTDTLGQNLNRYYLGSPDKDLQPSVWAIKRQLMHYVSKGALEFYLDLHAHANKKGVFIYGNALDSEKALASLLYARLIALNSPVFDLLSCNYTEKNMSRADKDGISKEGAARVALFKETGLTHLYTIEANYNTARALNIISPATGDHNGRASPPQGRRFPPKFATPVLQQVGRAFVIAALDLKNANPWSRLPNCEHRSLEGVASWITSVSRSPSETRLQNLPALSDNCVDSLRSLPNSACLLLDSLGLNPTQQPQPQQPTPQQSSTSWSAPSPSRRVGRGTQQNSYDSSPCSSAISTSTAATGGMSTPTSHGQSTPTPSSSCIAASTNGLVYSRRSIADANPIPLGPGPDDPAGSSSSRRSSATNAQINRRPVFLPSLPPTGQGGSSPYSSNSSIPTYNPTAPSPQQSLNRSTSMPMRSSGNAPTTSTRLNALARIPSGIPKPPSPQVDVAVQGVSNPSSDGSRNASDPGESGHMIALHPSSSTRPWQTRVRSGRHSGHALAQVPITEMRIKLSDPTPSSKTGGPHSQTDVQGRSKAVGSSQVLMVPVSGDGDGGPSAAALVLATAPWQQANGGIAPPASFGPLQTTPRVHTRLLAGLPTSLPAGHGLDDNSLTASHKSVEDTPLTPPMDTLITNIKVVGKLPAFGGRRRVVAGI